MIHFQRLALTTLTMFGGLAFVATAEAVSPARTPVRPEDLVMVLVWWAAAGAALWWLVSVGYWLVVLPRRRRRDHDESNQNRALSSPGARWVAEGLVAAGLVVLAACSPETATAPTMSLIDVASEPTTTAQPTTTASLTTAEVPTTRPSLPATSRPTTQPPPTETSVQAATEPSTTLQPTGDVLITAVDSQDAGQSRSAHSNVVAHEVSVDHGDNLWKLSADALEDAIDGPASCQLVAQYWRTVVAANHARSGNPDLIGVGETISMPAFSLATPEWESAAGVAG